MSKRKRVDIKAILADPILREEIMEGATDFICKVEGIRPHSLSPAAQAVLDATGVRGTALELPARGIAAAALQAAADQVVLMRPTGGRAWTVEQAVAYDALTKAFDLLNAIAAELEGADG